MSNSQFQQQVLKPPLQPQHPLRQTVPLTFSHLGASVAGGTAFTVTWTDSGDSPSISDLTAFQLLLYTGSNSSPVQLTSVTTSTFDASGDSISVTIPVTVGGETTNA